VGNLLTIVNIQGGFFRSLDVRLPQS